MAEINSVDAGPGGEPVYGGDPTGWPDAAFPLWNGVRARPLAAGGSAAQHKAHVDRLKARAVIVGGPLPAATTPAGSVSPPATLLGQPGKTITFFGSQFNAGTGDYYEGSDMSESMYTSGSNATLATTTGGGFTGDPKLWPDSAFPVWEGTVARSKASGGTSAQHAAHIARLEALNAKGVKTQGTAPSQMGMFGGSSDTTKYLLIGGAVVVGGVVIYYMTRPRRGLMGYVDRAKKFVGA